MPEDEKTDVIGGLDELLSAFAPKESTFDIPLPNGKKMIGRVVADASKMAEILKYAGKKVKAASTSPHKTWKPLLEGVDMDILRNCAINEQVVIEPQLSFVQWLKFSKQAGGVFGRVSSIVQAFVAGAEAVGAAEVLEDEKNDLGEIPSGEQD